MGLGRLCDCVESLCLSFSAVPGGVKRPEDSKAQLEGSQGTLGVGGWKSSPQALHPLCPDELVKGVPQGSCFPSWAP